MLRYFRCRWLAFDEDFDAVERVMARPPPDHLKMTYWQARTRFLLWSRNQAAAQALLDNAEIPYPQVLVPMLTTVAKTVIDPPFVADLEARSNNVKAPRAAALFSQIGAELYAFLRDYDRSLEFVRRAARANVFDIMWLERCPLFGPLRTMPGYDELRVDIESRAAKIRDELV